MFLADLLRGQGELDQATKSLLKAAQFEQAKQQENLRVQIDIYK